jgi:MFS family permease
MNAFIVAAVQYPLIRRLKGRDPMVLLAVSSGLLALGMGLTAFAFATWPLIVLVAVISLGEILLSPVATTVVGEMAPEEVRGRYMGVWTVVWSGGASLGPAFGGLAMDRLGGRQAFVVIMVVGAAGAALFPLLRRRPGQRLPRTLGLGPAAD